MEPMDSNQSPEQPMTVERLEELRHALLGEFHANIDGEAATRKTALTDIEDLKSEMLEAIKHIVKHSDSDALRAKVAMWGYDKLLEQGKVDSDPLMKFLDGMNNTKTEESTPV